MKIMFSNWVCCQNEHISWHSKFIWDSDRKKKEAKKSRLLLACAESAFISTYFLPTTVNYSRLKHSKTIIQERRWWVKRNKDRIEWWRHHTPDTGLFCWILFASDSEQKLSAILRRFDFRASVKLRGVEPLESVETKTSQFQRASSKAQIGNHLGNWRALAKVQKHEKIYEQTYIISYNISWSL